MAVIAAHQLKSSDIQIFTFSITEAEKLKEDKAWVKSLGKQTELIVLIYEVIIHDIFTSTINMKNQKIIIQQILTDNHTIIPKTEISHVG